MFSWTVLPNETLKLKQKMIYYLYSSQLSLFLLHTSGNKKNDKQIKKYPEI